jgi:hypothetical protein
MVKEHHKPAAESVRLTRLAEYRGAGSHMQAPSWTCGHLATCPLTIHCICIVE